MLIALENIPCVDFFSYVVQCAIVSVGNDFVAFRLEFLQIVYYQTAKEGCSIFECWLVNKHLCTFRLYALHNSLDRTLTEIIAVRLHRQSVDAYHAFLFYRRIVVSLFVIIVISSFVQHLVGNEILACTVAFHNGLNQVFRHI